MSACYIAAEKVTAQPKYLVKYWRKAQTKAITEKTDDIAAQYIRVARAFSDIYPSNSNSGFESKIQKTTSNIKIYPNPATDQINISLPKGKFDISVMDIQGKVIYRGNGEYQNIIDTNNWLSGIYQIFLKNTTTNEQEVHKIVVMQKD